VFINRSKDYIALPKCYSTHNNYEILSISLVPIGLLMAGVGRLTNQPTGKRVDTDRKVRIGQLKEGVGRLTNKPSVY
jgi:hypothetical protein